MSIHYLLKRNTKHIHTKLHRIVYKKLNNCMWIFFKSREVNGRWHYHNEVEKNIVLERTKSLLNENLRIGSS